MLIWPSKAAAESTAGFLGHHWMSKHHCALVGSSYRTWQETGGHACHTALSIGGATVFFESHLSRVGVPAQDPVIFPTAQEQLWVCYTPRYGQDTSESTHTQIRVRVCDVYRQLFFKWNDVCCQLLPMKSSLMPGQKMSLDDVMLAVHIHFLF